MSTQRRQIGWFFRHPDLDEPDRTPGLELTNGGRVRMVSDEACVRQALLLLLSTRPGERAMRPDYGCPLHRLAFAVNDATTAGLAVHYVRKAIERWEPRVVIERLDATPDAADIGQLLITVAYRVRATNRIDTIAVNVPLDGRVP